jgi:DNA-binding transcriptional LysR family regulator
MQQWNWDDVRVLLAVSRAGTLAGAGRTLGVNPTTIGRRLAGFEERMGALLFHRTSDGLVATPVAESLVEPAELMERQAALIADRAGGQDMRLSGTVRVAVSTQFASHFLVDHLMAFRTRYPDIMIELRASTALADLSRDEADMAIRFVRPGHNVPHAAAGPVEIIAQKVGDVGIGVFASRSYLEARGWPTDANDLEGHDVILPSEGIDYFPGNDWIQQASQYGHVQLRLDDLTAMVSASAAGFGLCAMPSFMAVRFPVLQRVSPPHNIDIRETWILEASDLRRRARNRLVREYLVQLFDTWGAVLGDEGPAPKRT